MSVTSVSQLWSFALTFCSIQLLLRKFEGEWLTLDFGMESCRSKMPSMI